VSPGALKGRVSFPGDYQLTLEALAFGILSGAEVNLLDVSPAPEVEEFAGFLRGCGVSVERLGVTITISGQGWKDRVVVDSAVPDTVLPCVVGSSVFSSREVRITGGAGERAGRVSPVLDMLRQVGLRDENVAVSDTDLVIRDAEFSPKACIETDTVTDFETVAAAAMAKRRAVLISFPYQAAAHTVRLLSMLGCSVSSPEGGDDTDEELMRRLARAGKDEPHERREFSWNGDHASVIKIPGDTTLAASIGGAAVLVQGSHVTLEKVLWERSRRGFFEALRRMKCQVDATLLPPERFSFDSADITMKWSKCDGISVTPGQARTMEAELPILCAVASCATGTTVIRADQNVPGFGKDRCRAMARGLEILGGHVGSYADGIVFHGIQELRGGEVDAGDSEHVALGLALAGLAAWGTTTLDNVGEQSYLFELFRRLIGELSAGKQRALL